MARIIRDLSELPERTTPIPGSKPPVFNLPYHDPEGRPEEVDEFLELVRRLRRGNITPVEPTK